MKRKDLIVFMCPGLGYINRGYETHMRELFDVLKEEKIFDIILLKRNGNCYEKEWNVFSLKRKWKVTKFLSFLTRKKSTSIEQMTFFIFSIFYIIIFRPNAIYVADYLLSKLLMKFKLFFKLNFKIIFRNGNNYLPPYENADYIQQMLYTKVNMLNLENCTFKKQFCIPHGFHTELFKRTKTKYDIRKELNLPNDKKIILSVGQVDKSIKRMDYVIREVSTLKFDFYLLIIGQDCDETPEIYKLATKHIGLNNFSILQVNYTLMPTYYQAADFFVSASLNEGFGRMYVEAALSNLPMIVHDYEVVRDVLGLYPKYMDLNFKGNLAAGLNEFNSYNFNIETSYKNDIVKKFDWYSVNKDYLKMFEDILRN